MVTEIPLNWHEFKEALNQSKDKIFGWDTETNAEDCRDGRGYLIGMSLSVRLEANLYGAIYIPVRHEEGNVDAELLEDVRRTLLRLDQEDWWAVFHNAKFDLVSITTVGFKWEGNFYDTLKLCHLIDENAYSYDLSSCVRRYVDKEESKKNDDRFKAWVELRGWGGVPVDEMEVYARHDAVITLALLYAILPQVEEDVPVAYWATKQKFIRVIIAMERRGVRVDTDLCERMTARGEAVLEDLAETVDGNMGSRKFLEKVLIDELGLPEIISPKTGNRTFDKNAMAEYESYLERLDSPMAEFILTHRGWQKSVSSNYRPYVALLSPDGRLRCNYKLHGTRTGRLSCEKPNLQQIPKATVKPWNGVMKSAFTPESDEWVLYEFDYAQLELRLGAAYAKEESLLRAFEEDRDVFTEMSGTLGFTRPDTKTFVYSTQYGAGNTRISNVFRVSLGRAQEMRDHYKRQYPGFALMTQRSSMLCKRNGKIKLWSGRYRHFRSRNDDAHKAFNSVIQGGAADIVESVMVRLFEEVDNEKECRMLLQVHDSVVFEIRKDRLDYYKPLIEKIMSDVRPDFGVKFAVDGHEWGK